MKRLLGLLAWGLLFWLTGCATMGSTNPVFDREGEALELIWKTYGRTDSPPIVRWVTGSDLDCIDPNSGKQGFTVFEPDDSGEHPIRCREGYTMHFDWFLAAYHGERSIADTAVCHEMKHVALVREGVYVGHHKRDDFYPDIEKADARLRAAGY